MSPLQCLLPLALLLAAPLAGAQYKVVGPDGKVSYTDQPPPADARKVQAINIRGAGGTGVVLSDLPASLRPVATRYPVTLYASKDCTSCDNGRQLLTQRGIPFAEKRVESDADAAALARLSGARTLPLLTIGNQQLKGLTSSEWHSYLDAAGYPKTSALPGNYRAPAPSPLTTPAAEAPAAAAEPPPPADSPRTETRKPGTTPNIRF